MKVLLVEDHVHAARVTMRLLRRSGIEVEHVMTKSAALRRLRAQMSWSGFIIDVLLADGESGLDVLDHIAAAHATTPRIVVSGVLDRRVINHVQRAGAHYVCKPIQSDILARFAFDALSSCIDDVPLRNHVVAWGWRAKLTAKEQEVLSLNVATGLVRSECRAVMNVSEKTLAAHHRSILAKAAIHGERVADMASLVVALLLGARRERHR
jgi:FixJ family two-component response regulator